MSSEFKWGLIAASSLLVLCVIVSLFLSSVSHPTETQIRLSGLFEHGISLGMGFFFGGIAGKSATLPH